MEVLAGISGVEFADCYSRRRAVAIDGVPADLIAREDLIANKKAAGRPKDLADLEQISRNAPPAPADPPQDPSERA